MNRLFNYNYKYKYQIDGFTITGAKVQTSYKYHIIALAVLFLLSTLGN